MNIIDRMRELAGSDSSEALTGTTEARQSQMDALCRNLHMVSDLNSLRDNVDDANSFKDLFKGWNDQLKRPTEFNRDRGNGFVWDNTKPANPVIIDGATGILQEDLITMSFEIDGAPVDWFQPDHYRSSPIQHSLVLGNTAHNRAVAIQGNWKGTFGARQTSWWAYTAIMVPSMDADEWFDEVVRLNYGVSSYNEYSEATEQSRKDREAEYDAKVAKGTNRGRHLASSI
tara:strand:- start:8780 stop:9466 length:687 start_codon:yes stop_codon:yes gene_type:complete